MPFSTVGDLIGKDKNQRDDFFDSRGRDLDNASRWRLV